MSNFNVGRVGANSSVKGADEIDTDKKVPKTETKGVLKKQTSDENEQVEYQEDSENEKNETGAIDKLKSLLKQVADSFKSFLNKLMGKKEDGGFKELTKKKQELTEDLNKIKEKMSDISKSKMEIEKIETQIEALQSEIDKMTDQLDKNVNTKTHKNEDVK